jgi:hypothetical protein
VFNFLMINVKLKILLIFHFFHYFDTIMYLKSHAIVKVTTSHATTYIVVHDTCREKTSNGKYIIRRHIIPIDNYYVINCKYDITIYKHNRIPHDKCFVSSLFGTYLYQREFKIHRHSNSNRDNSECLCTRCGHNPNNVLLPTSDVYLEDSQDEIEPDQQIYGRYTNLNTIHATNVTNNSSNETLSNYFDNIFQSNNITFNNPNYVEERQPTIDETRRSYVYQPPNVEYINSPRYGRVRKDLFPDEPDVDQYKNTIDSKEDIEFKKQIAKAIEASKSAEQRFQDKLDKMIKDLKSHHLTCNIVVEYNPRNGKHIYTIITKEEAIPDEEMMRCVICFGDLTKVDFEINSDGSFDIVAPCKCRGSGGIMHESCYQNCIKHDTLECNICKSHFVKPNKIRKVTKSVLTSDYQHMINT